MKVPGGYLRVERRQACIRDFEKFTLRLLRANSHTQVDIACPGSAQPFVVLRDGLDIDARPASLVESARHGVDVGILGADIDIEPLRHVLERTPQHDVFVILRI